MADSGRRGGACGLQAAGGSPSDTRVVADGGEEEGV